MRSSQEIDEMLYGPSIGLVPTGVQVLLSAFVFSWFCCHCY